MVRVCKVVVAASLFFAIVSGPAVNAQGPQDPVEFNRDVRPILSDKCFRCHGPDAKERQADLRFDVEASAKGDLDGHRAIVPGKPDESVLVARITAQDVEERMPPADSGKQLSDREIKLLQRWIAERSTIAAVGEHAVFVGINGARLGPRIVQRRIARWARLQGLPEHVPMRGLASIRSICESATKQTPSTPFKINLRLAS